MWLWRIKVKGQWRILGLIGPLDLLIADQSGDK